MLEVGLMRAWSNGREKKARSACFFPDGSCRVATAQTDGSIQVFNWRDGRLLVHIERAHNDELNVVLVTPDARYLISGGDDSRICVHESDTGLFHADVDVWRGSTVYSLALSRDGTRLIACFWNGKVSLLSFPDLNVIRHLEGHRGVVMGIAISPDAKTALSAAWDSKCVVWDLTAQGPDPIVASFDHGCDCNAVAITNDGRMCVTGSDDGHVSLFDLSGNVRLARFADHDDMVVSVAVASSHDAILIASASWDTTVKLRLVYCSTDANHLVHVEAQPPRVVVRHEKKIICVRFDNTGTRLVSASFDSMTKVVDAFWEDRQRLLTFATMNKLPLDLLPIVRYMLFS